jgi:hypothetical protein
MHKKEACFIAGRYDRLAAASAEERLAAPVEISRPLEDLITGYFFSAAEVLAQLEKELPGADTFLKS